ncbi:dihydroorotase [Sporolactobacillus shoreicorticis]|uniref:Dihydroorotase family protein n=1 Tax=Sporolactobacillus shoreicorticis TaxID=1923877 RepID=A0ABW5S3I7_9BACL|nr:dihydroorotase [Sporolactobacillus shoreicorticis]MCO7124301.1 dihydroorotase [Sporolactobacillus shoreicorticis]
MEPFDLVVKGNIVLPDKVMNGAIGISKGKITHITDQQNGLVSKNVKDFNGSFIFPGFIDTHVHCYSNPDEGVAATSEAAAFGGVTTFFDMPYDRPDPINNVKIFEKKIQRLEGKTVVDICLWGTIAKKNGTDQIIPMAKAGAVAFKLSTFETDPYRFPRIPDPEILKAMKIIKEVNLRAAFHSENGEVIYQMIEEYQKKGKVYPRAHMETRPPVTETSAILKLLEFAYWTGAKLHIVHVSHPRSIELIQLFKKQGVQVTCETCYHYLLLDVHDLEEQGPRAKMNPPVREPEDVQKMWEKLEGNQIDMITSDHAPWSLEQKIKGKDNIFKSPSGLPGVELLIPLMFDGGVMSGRLTPVQFAHLLATHPAEAYQVPGKGKITIGYDADLTIIDPSKQTIIDEMKLHSQAKLTPFNQKKLRGKIIETIIRGNTVFDGTKITADMNYGKFVPGSAAE